MNRRGFLKGILAAGVAPYVITTPGLLMPGRGILVPSFYKTQGRVRWVSIAEREAEMLALANPPLVIIQRAPGLVLWGTRSFFADVPKGFPLDA